MTPVMQPPEKPGLYATALVGGIHTSYSMWNGRYWGFRMTDMSEAVTRRAERSPSLHDDQERWEWRELNEAELVEYASLVLDFN